MIAAEHDARRVAGVAWAGEREVAHAIAHAMPRAAIEDDRGAAGAGVGERHHIARQADQKYRLVVRREGDRRGEGTAIVEKDGAAALGEVGVGGVDLLTDIGARKIRRDPHQGAARQEAVGASRDRGVNS